MILLLSLHILAMPLIEISMYPGRAKERKEAFAKAITNAAVEILKTKPEHVIIIYDERSRKLVYLRRTASSRISSLLTVSYYF
jgi:4-oxalocrotonate tautomerase